MLLTLHPQAKLKKVEGNNRTSSRIAAQCVDPTYRDSSEFVNTCPDASPSFSLGGAAARAPLTSPSRWRTRSLILTAGLLLCAGSGNTQAAGRSRFRHCEHGDTRSHFNLACLHGVHDSWARLRIGGVEAGWDIFWLVGDRVQVKKVQVRLP